MASLRRRSTLAALKELCKPLLKFSGKAHLDEQGLDSIRKIPGLIYPVILLGDGRAGKSYLASRLLNLPEAFESSDSADPVTEGIDVAVVPMDSLLASTLGLPPRGAANGQEGQEPMHMVILDCEGGNNAMASIRTLVNVFAAVVACEVVFVSGGMFSEAALQNLAATLAARSLVKNDASGLRLPPQKLVFVVNKTTLKYDADTLDKALCAEQKDPSRRENRELVMSAFAEQDRSFIPIPMIGAEHVEDQVACFRRTVLEDRRPLELGGAKVRAAQLVSLLHVVFDEMDKMAEVNFPSMGRCIIVDGVLRPLANRLLDEAERACPSLDDYDPALAEKDPRRAALAEFDAEADHITEKNLVSEERARLEKLLDAMWIKVEQVNTVLGDQIADIRSDTREIVVDEAVVPLGGKGLLARVSVRQQTVRVVSRRVTTKKSGAVEYGDFVDTNELSQRIKETAFRNFKVRVPSLVGRLRKRSPSWVRTAATFGAGMFQERTCVVKEGHLIWWDAERTSPDQEVSGCINFLLNRAKCEQEEDSNFLFVIRPATEEGWSDTESFTCGKFRELVFNVEGSEYPLKDWMEVVQKNIAFADDARDAVGDRLRSEVASHKPVLSTAMWGMSPQR